MVVTRNMEPLIKVIDERFEAFKNSLLKDLKAELKSFSELQKEEISSYLDVKKGELSSSVNAEYTKSIISIQKHVTELKSKNAELSKTVENLQQYIRGPNIRIFGVPVPVKESSGDVERLVTEIMDRTGMDIPHANMDRAHRIGKKKRRKMG